MNNNDKYLTVGAVTRYLKYKFDNDEHLRHIFIKGEISNFKYHTSGHLYFSIKDETSKINAIMFNTSAKKLTFKPSDGSKVLVSGRITIYEATGGYQIYVDEMLEDGIGNLYIEFEKLKEKLLKEGLFAPEHKRSIPAFPTRIGIVTAPTGAAIKDILSTIKRRFPICETILFPSLVQGEAAANDIVRNITMAQDYDLDVLIVGRGGGSIEDLWPFNEEIVARAIYASKIPVISAVGHEVDFTISDFVADLRAPTPTGAAELAVPNIVDLIKHLEQLKIRINEAIIKKIKFKKVYLDSIKNSFVIKNPIMMYEAKKQKIDIINEKIISIINNKISNYNLVLNNIRNKHILKNPDLLYKNEVIKLNNIIEKLNLVNPLNILSRGFSVTYINNKVVSSIENLKVNDNIKVKLNDGCVDATINKILEDKYGKKEKEI